MTTLSTLSDTVLSAPGIVHGFLQQHEALDRVRGRRNATGDFDYGVRR